MHKNSYKSVGRAYLWDNEQNREEIMNIQHNMSAASANRHLRMNDKGFRVSTQRLATGYRINSAADDAAGLSISEKLRWQVRGMNRASENIGDGIALTQVADGALQEVHNLLQRMVELTVQAANDTNTEEDRLALQQEISEIKTEINRISNDTEFNTIKLFKPTSTPKLSGNPTDLLVYRQDYPGMGTREGGIIYKGVRYAYEDMGLNFDANGNIAAGTYPVEVEAEDGNPVIINLIFDGGSRIPSGRQYELVSDQNGVSIDRILHPWSEIKNADGDSIKQLNNKGGEYSFMHAGMKVSFEVKEGDDLVTIISSLKKDGLDTYELRSKKMTLPGQPVNPNLTMTRNEGGADVNFIKVTPANAAYLPKHTNTNVGHYKIRADENEIRLVLPDAENLSGGEVVLDSWTWDQLTPPLQDAKWGNLGGVNPSADVETEGKTHYSFTDSKVFSRFDFTIDSEASKQDLINAMNNWEITVTMNTGMQTSITTAPAGNVSVSLAGRPAAWSYYGTQYQMGLMGDTQRPLQLTPAAVTANAAGRFEFTVRVPQQPPGEHVFTASTGPALLRNQIVNNFNLNSRINSVIQALEAGRTPSQSYSGGLSFTSSSAGSLSLSARENITNWFTSDPDMFIREQDPQTGKVSYRFNETKRAGLEQRISDLADRVVASYLGTTVNLTATGTGNANQVQGTMQIVTNDTINNTRYSSVAVPSDRELKIQSSSRAYDDIPITLCAIDTGILDLETVDVTSHLSASESLGKIYSALNRISEIRSGFGATQNRLESAMKVDDIIAENSQAAESLLRDADMADESVTNAMHRILMQSGQSMLAQANMTPQNILQLFS